ncbi:MAG TPA: hypothetical protein VKD90_20595 [Gemmataceae bacterium]|nr:hypothetical protein [Gemmataceae bacterium]
MILNEDEMIRKVIEGLRTMTDEEHDAIMAELVRKGIMDEDGNVLKRFPEPPEWLTQANGRPKSNPEPEKLTQPAKKTKRRRKRS